tara:strand:- start:68 stop:451 length:384 start_codon:yes stop_codon:yes gene_type:complete
MTLTKRQLNNKLKTKILEPICTIQNIEYIKDFEIKVMRARSIPYTDWTNRRRIERSKTLVTVKIKGNVVSSTGRLLSVQEYGPRHIRNYLRRKNNGIVGAVSAWVKLWGFDNEVELERIDLVKSIDA